MQFAFGLGEAAVLAAEQGRWDPPVWLDESVTGRAEDCSATTYLRWTVDGAVAGASCRKERERNRA